MLPSIWQMCSGHRQFAIRMCARYHTSNITSKTLPKETGKDRRRVNTLVVFITASLIKVAFMAPRERVTYTINIHLAESDATIKLIAIAWNAGVVFTQGACDDIRHHGICFSWGTTETEVAPESFRDTIISKW